MKICAKKKKSEVRAFPELVYPKDTARSLHISAFHALISRDDGLSLFYTGYSNCETAVVLQSGGNWHEQCAVRNVKLVGKGKNHEKAHTGKK